MLNMEASVLFADSISSEWGHATDVSESTWREKEDWYAQHTFHPSHPRSAVMMLNNDNPTLTTVMSN